jgi:hypothetical protein
MQPENAKMSAGNELAAIFLATLIGSSDSLGGNHASSFNDATRGQRPQTITS